MIRPPFMARVVAGLAVTAYEEACKLPSTAVTLPMTAVSQVLQTSMRLQQTVTSLAIKGDRVFSVFDRTAEEPSWAVFDEDRSDGEPDVEPTRESGRAGNGTNDAAATDDDADSTDSADTADSGSSSAPGRFALYSMSPAEGDAAAAAPERESASGTDEQSGDHVPVPEIADELDYAALTLAQLRSRLRSLSVDDLTALLEYEERTAARAPFQTMLANRITSARAK